MDDVAENIINSQIRVQATVTPKVNLAFQQNSVEQEGERRTWCQSISQGG